MITRSEERCGRFPQSVAADTTYGNGELLAWFEERDITPYIRVKERKSCPQNQPVRDREVHLRCRDEQLSMSGRKAAYLCGYQCHKSNACVRDDVEALSRLPAKNAM